jgi:serine phosphatase RsbU (regulator of sigma subunit)
MPLVHLWSLIGWSALALLCASLALVFRLGRMGFRIHLRVRYQRGGARDAPVPEWTLTSVAVVLAAAVLYQLAEGHSQALRLIWAAAGAGLLVAAAFWAGNAIKEFSLARQEAHQHWRREAARIGAQIREWTEAPAVRAASCRALAEALRTGDVRLFLRQDNSYRIAYDTTGREREPAEVRTNAALAQLLERQGSAHPLVFDDNGPQLALPVSAAGALDGFFLLDGGPYEAAELHFSTEIARETARALAVAGHLGRQVETRTAVLVERRELDNTRRALQQLVAPDLPAIPGLDYAAEYWRGDRPGGQFLDLVALPGQSLGVVLADLSGTGLDAAVRMAQLQTLLRSRFWAYADDLPELLQSTERALLGTRPAPGRMGIFLGCYRPATRTLKYVNAGALPPVLIRRGGEGAQVLRLSETAGALCAAPNETLQVADIVLESGDALAIVNRGVVEALNASAEGWGEARLTETLMAWENQRAADLVSLVLRTVEEHTGQQQAALDRTMILLKA